MARASGAAEPTMEEILASIRQIIEQGDAERSAQAAPALRASRARAVEAVAPAPVQNAGGAQAATLPEDVEAGFVLRPSFEGSAALAFDDLRSVGNAPDPYAPEPSAPEPSAHLRSEAAPLEAAPDESAPIEASPVDTAIDWAGGQGGARGADASTGWHQGTAEPALAAMGHDGFDLESMLAAELSDESASGTAEGHAGGPEVRAANSDDPRLGRLRDRLLDDAQSDTLPPRHAEPLISASSEAAISASFAELTEAIRAGELRSLEEMAQELLRPMMREWLEDNLARMVEEIVRDEIRRAVTRGR